MKKEEIINRMHPLIFKGICHRGLHNKDNIENGMRAFSNALREGMALELDVHLSLDGELVVCHDSDLSRVTGRPGIIEHLNYPEIVRDYPLLDGETVPTLPQVFDLIREQVPIVLELKVFENNFKELCKSALCRLHV